MPTLNPQDRRDLAQNMQTDLRNTLAGARVDGPGDDLYDIAVAISGALSETQALLARAVDESFDDTASFDALKKRHRHRLGDPTGAVAATLSLTVTGVAGSTWAVTDLLVSRDTGLRYAPISSGTMPVAATTVIAVTCLTGGDAGALVAGRSLIWSVPPTGMDATAVTTGNPTGGTAAENVDEYRARVFDYYANPTAGGTERDFARWALMVDGVGYATAFANRRDLGTCDVAVLDHEGDNVAATVLIAVQAKLDLMRPCTAYGSLAVHPVLTDLDVEFNLKMAAGYEFSSWTARAVAAGSTASQLLFADAPDAPAAGDWIACPVVVNGRALWQAREVYAVSEYLGPGGIPGTAIALRSAFSAAPETGVMARPGCSTFDQLALAVQAYFASLQSGGTFYTSACARYLLDNPEVLSAAIVAPAADVPAAADETVIEHLVLDDLKLNGV
ncbi:baseplate J/gp47 family protein [Zavarzinia sp.]|uniref:baseplate J/gp47 family protein n=1 Tax=Zavarzinia sp. TaxID=2027920 RepID=UPI00356A2540